MAGGFLSNANAALSTVFRRGGLDEWGRISDLRYALSGGLDGGREALEITLQPDDSVFVPYLLGFVTVSGEVLSPGRFPYVPGQAALYYVRAAGGFLPDANSDLVDIFNRVAKATRSHSPGVLINDGDEIVVIKQENR
jgi:protein involved in polysaccharide export with SLBB domain